MAVLKGVSLADFVNHLSLLIVNEIGVKSGFIWLPLTTVESFFTTLAEKKTKREKNVIFQMLLGRRASVIIQQWRRNHYKLLGIEKTATDKG